MLAYSFLVALLPIAVTLLGILGLIFKDHPQTQQDFKDKITQLFPSDDTTQKGIKQVWKVSHFEENDEEFLIR